MKAMILAGGMSTRLYPLTKQVPKPLVPVVGQPNAVHVMRYLAGFGYDQIAINVHYLADAIAKRLGDGSEFGVRLTYLHESELLGSAGAVKQMESFFDEPFVVVGCDDLTNFPLDELMAFGAARSAVATIGLVRTDDVQEYGVVVLDPNGKIVGFQEKPAPGTERSNLVNTGIYGFTPEIFRHIAADAFVDFGKNVFPALQTAGEAFYGFEASEAFWCDIGTISEYRRATREVLEGKLRLGHSGAMRQPGAKVDPTVRVEGNAFIGNAVVGAGSLLTGSCVVSDGVHIGANVRLSSSILWEGVTIGDGAVVEDSILGLNYRVEAGNEISGQVLAHDC